MSLEAHFKIKEHGSTLYREIIGGVTTFIALSYIIFVQPAVLAAAGARTGLAPIVTGLLLLLSPLAYPFVGVFGTEVSVPASLLHPAAWAP